MYKISEDPKKCSRNYYQSMDILIESSWLANINDYTKTDHSIVTASVWSTFCMNKCIHETHQLLSSFNWKLFNSCFFSELFKCFIGSNSVYTMANEGSRQRLWISSSLVNVEGMCRKMKLSMGSFSVTLSPLDSLAWRSTCTGSRHPIS